MVISSEKLEEIYQRLYQAYGRQNWWPAESPFEVMVGAILTQNTSWTNVEKAIQNLKQAQSLKTRAIIEMPDETLADLIKPSGYFNIKTQRLKNYTNWFVAEGKFNGLNKLDDKELRNCLLKVNGIGPETADDILLYAFERPVFVIDTYTRRLLKTYGLITGDEPYEILRQFFESSLTPDVVLFKEYHALIVRHAKEKCLKIPDCRHCIVEAPLM
jgi:endonuclease III related protein